MDAREVWKLRPPDGGTRVTNAGEAWSPVDTRLAVATFRAGVSVWDVATGVCVRALPHLRAVTAVRWSPEGRHLVAGLDSGEILVLDAVEGTELGRQAAHGRDVSQVAVSPDGERLASSSHDGTVRVSRVRDLSSIVSISHFPGASVIAWAPGGGSIATGSGDSHVRVWDPSTGYLQGELADHHSFVSAVAYSPDGQLLASASGDQTVRIWDLASAEYLHVADQFQRAVSDLSFSPDGRSLAAIEETRISILDIQSRQVVMTIPVAMSNLTVSWSNDGCHLASGAFTGLVQVWAVG